MHLALMQCAPGHPSPMSLEKGHSCSTAHPHAARLPVSLGGSGAGTVIWQKTTGWTVCFGNGTHAARTFDAVGEHSAPPRLPCSSRACLRAYCTGVNPVVTPVTVLFIKWVQPFRISQPLRASQHSSFFDLASAFGFKVRPPFD